VPGLTVPPGVEGIVSITELPDPGFVERWERIILPQGQKEHLLNHLLLSLGHRSEVSSIALPIHGLLLLAGPPGTGKTTLAGGLADQAARILDGDGLLFVDIDPHAYPSQMLGESQRATARLFERTIPDLAQRGQPVVVLLDEVEALAVNRAGASLETNPVDVHRATDAVLAGIDHVSEVSPNVTFVATTNYIAGVDGAFISRADVVEMVAPPDADAIRAILRDTLVDVAPDAAADGDGLEGLATRLAAAEMDARQVRKLVIRAICSRRDLALDPSALTVVDIGRTFDAAFPSRGAGAAS
jgi:SpoVK/Ycf46/Vps4 family AAA+-type ATPase